MKGPMSTACNVNLAQRRSPRIRKIRDVYEAENVEIVDLHSESQKYVVDDDVITKKIKIEMLEPEDDKCISKPMEVNSLLDNALDEKTLINVTLKDLRKRCKEKKTRYLNSVSPLKADLDDQSSHNQSKMQNHDDVKLKQEEPDLEEPLINLKRKHFKGSYGHKERRQSGFVSLDPLLSEDNGTASSNQSAAPGQGLLATVKDNSSTKCCVSEDIRVLDLVATVSDVPIINVERKHEKAYAGGNKRQKSEFEEEEVTPFSTSQSSEGKQDILSTLEHSKFTKYQVPDVIRDLDMKITVGIRSLGADSTTVSKGGPLNADIPEFVCHVKSEIMEDFSTDYHIDHAISGISSASLLQKYDQDSHSSFLSLHKCAQSSSDFHAHCHKNSIVPENGELAPAVFIGTSGCPEVFDRDNENVPENGELAPVPNESQLSIINEVSTDFIKPGNHVVIPQTGEEYIGETESLLSMPNQNAVPSVLEDMEGPPDSCIHMSISLPLNVDHSNISCSKRQKPQQVAHESKAEERKFPAIDHIRGVMEAGVICAVNMENNDTQDLPSGSPLEDEPLSIRVNDVIDDHNLLCKEVYGLEEIFLCGKDCGDSSHGAVAGRIRCSLPLSKTCFGAANVLDQANEHSSKIESFSKLEKALSGQVEKTRHFSGKAHKLTPLCESTEPDHQSASAVLLSGTASNVVHYEDESSRKHSNAVEEKCDATSNQPTITRAFHAIAQSNRQLECDQELLEDHHPKKLLSYRKTISPSSQEKLCRALSDIDLHDVSQVTGKKEVESILDTEKINTPRNHCNGPLAKKAALAAQETSGQMPCFCMKSSSLQTNMEKAIEFSQRQMHDIERISKQLLTGLNSMKPIVEETINLQAHSSLPSKFTAEEIKAAAESVSELEKTTRKWLSIMTKDCNRFCKIMKSTDNKSTAPVDGIRKERKVTFADEVGGALCQVKFYLSKSPSIAPQNEQAG